MAEKDQAGKINIPALVKKLQAILGDEEINYLLQGSEEQREEIASLLLNKTKEPQPSLAPPKEDPADMEKLIKQNLLMFRYYIFEICNFSFQRGSEGAEFKGPTNHKYISVNLRIVPPFYNLIQGIPEEAFKFIEGDRDYNPWDPEKKLPYFKRVKFQTDKDEEAILGRAAIIRVDLEKKPSVLIHGAFSTDRNRVSGRINNDNQIMFSFKDEISANRFYDLFDDSPFRGNPIAVEKNTGIIEKAMKTIVDQQTFNRFQSRLLLGLEVKKFRRK